MSKVYFRINTTLVLRIQKGIVCKCECVCITQHKGIMDGHHNFCNSWKQFSQNLCIRLPLPGESKVERNVQCGEKAPKIVDAK